MSRSGTGPVNDQHWQYGCQNIRSLSEQERVALLVTEIQRLAHSRGTHPSWMTRRKFQAHHPYPARWIKGVWGRAKEQVKGEIDPDEKVYFVEASGLDRIKIGVTTNIENRLRKLQCGSPVPLIVVALIPGGEQLEKRIHTTLADSRVQGEWFRAEQVKAWLTGLITDSTVK